MVTDLAWPADPNVVRGKTDRAMSLIVKKKKKNLIKNGEQESRRRVRWRNEEVTSSSTFLGEGGGKNVPKLLRLQGRHLTPFPLAFFFYLRTFPFFALMCFTVWLLFLVSPCFNSCASPSSYRCPHPLFPLSSCVSLSADQRNARSTSGTY